MLSEQHTWEIIGDHFKKKGFVFHQTDSFDNFISVGITKIITEEPDIIIIPKTKESKFDKYTVSFSDVYIPSPTVIEESRELRGFYPSEARQRDLTYDSPIYITVTEIIEIDGQEPEVIKHLRVVIGRIPIMLRSCKCYLHDMTPDERIRAGECEFDEGGYFIVKGKERALVMQQRAVYNIPLVFEQKLSHKNAFICETRSMSEETGHSTLIQAMIGSNDRTLMFSLPYVKDLIPIGVVFKALGYTTDHIPDLIGLDCQAINKYIGLIINDSFFVEEQGTGFELLYENIETLIQLSRKLNDNTLGITGIMKINNNDLKDIDEDLFINWNNFSQNRNELLYLNLDAINILGKQTDDIMFIAQKVWDDLDHRDKAKVGHKVYTS